MNKQTTNTNDKNSNAAKNAGSKQNTVRTAVEGSKTAGTSTDNEGEGSRSGARAYDNDVRDFVKSGQVDASARSAEKAVDGPEGATLRKAEQAGKNGPKPKAKA